MAAFPDFFPHEGDLDRYIRHLADLMGLRDWKINLEDVHPGEDCLGHCECVYGRRIANIRLAEHDTIEELRHTIVHELLHAHLDPVRLPVENVRNVLGQPLYDVTRAALIDAVEYATDAIATAWAETLPLPIRDESEAA